MKKCLIGIFLFWAALSVHGQAPQKINYQAVARDAQGNLFITTNLDIEFSIRTGSPNGTILYQETHPVTTNTLGLFDAAIGEGQVLSGAFASIPWNNGIYFLQIRINAGQGYTDMGTSQLLSVPYALHARTSGVADSLAGGIPGINAPYMPDTSQPILIAFQGNILYVTPSDYSSALPYGGYGFLIGNNGQSFTNGALNTSSIVNTVGPGSYAAKICDDLVAFGFNDWYLPSLYEMNAIDKQSYLLSGLKLEQVYWTSTEQNAQNAWRYNLSNGEKTVSSKNASGYLRCVRR